MSREVTLGALQRLVELVESADEKVALGASLAILEPQREAEAAERRNKEAATKANLKAARENLTKQWEKMTPEQRVARLENLQAESADYKELEEWVEAQLEGYDVEWLASGEVPKYESP
jgi:hypothetical protein